jgi:DNA polymerase III subunit epsilon
VSAPSAPRRRARRGHWRTTEFASLDFETTGLDYDHDAIVSFGVVPVRSGRVSVAGSVYQLVTPTVDSSARSMTIHEILPRDLLDAPPLEEARATLRSCIEGRFLLTWYAEVELAFLHRTFGGSRRSWVRRTIDVRQMAIALEHAHQDVRFTLSATAERYGVPAENPHVALDDALVTAELFLVLATKLEERGFGRTSSFLRLTRV